MAEASVTNMGKPPTREIKVAGRVRTIVLNADLKLRLQDISRRAMEEKIGAVEAQRQICIAIYGPTFWESIPFEMADAFSEPASQIYFDMFAIKVPGKDDKDADEDGDTSGDAKEPKEDDGPPEPGSKNAEPPPGEG